MTLKLRFAVIGILMAVVAASIGAFAAESGRPYPPPFPRQGSVKLLENNRIVVWDVTWPKGYQSPLHEHYSDAVIVTLTGGVVKVTPLHGASSTVSYKAGSVIFAPKGAIHREEGLSATPRRAIVIQLK